MVICANACIDMLRLVPTEPGPGTCFTYPPRVEGCCPRRVGPGTEVPGPGTEVPTRLDEGATGRLLHI